MSSISRSRNNIRHSKRATAAVSCIVLLMIRQFTVLPIMSNNYVAVVSAFSSPLSSSWLPNNNSAKPNKPWYFDEQHSDPATATSIHLPFDCTGCGKCCKTRGTVLLSPEELVKAAKLLRISIQEFKQLYVAKEQEMDDAVSTTIPELRPIGWVQLRDKEEEATDLSSGYRSGGCIFLDEENKCKIYEARPMQCSTYPFWPRIMASR